jgi:hypothetical protein
MYGPLYYFSVLMIGSDLLGYGNYCKFRATKSSDDYCVLGLIKNLSQNAVHIILKRDLKIFD